MFQCIFDSTRRDILAAGGRYDKLVEENRPATQDSFTGMTLACLYFYGY